MSKQVGIITYGSALPDWCLLASELAQARGGEVPALGVKQKTVAEPDQDSATLAVESASQALWRLSRKQREVVRSNIGAVWVGSESPAYAVKPAGVLLQAALGLRSELATADLQFACKAGTQGMQIAAQYVATGQAQYSLAIGADTAQSRPGDVLEFTAGAGAAAFVFGEGDEVNRAPVIAELLYTCSFASDTPDFWRRPEEIYPMHAGRFSGEPAYFDHIKQNTAQVLKVSKLSIESFAHCVFHTPNGKFPTAVAKQLGCQTKQLEHSLIVREIGNTYAAAVPLALANVLDHAQPGEHILQVSYGSGAGSDAFIWQVTDAITAYRQRATRNTHTLAQHIARLQPISYTQYRQWADAQRSQPGGTA